MIYLRSLLGKFLKTFREILDNFENFARTSLIKLKILQRGL